MSIVIYLFEFQLPMCSRNTEFLKRDCGTIPFAEIISGKIEIFSKHQRFLIAAESSKYLLFFCIIHCPPKLSHKVKTRVFEPKYISSYNISNCKVLKD
jgi:hypothetical protein